MSVSFMNATPGKRVRLTRKDATVEITVRGRDFNYVSGIQTLFAERDGRMGEGFRNDHWDSIEILPDLLPTKPGYYVSGPHVYYQVVEGRWQWASEWQYVSPEDVPSPLVYLGTWVES